MRTKLGKLARQIASNKSFDREVRLRTFVKFFDHSIEITQSDIDTAQKIIELTDEEKKALSEKIRECLDHRAGKILIESYGDDGLYNEEAFYAACIEFIHIFNESNETYDLTDPDLDFQTQKQFIIDYAKNTQY